MKRTIPIKSQFCSNFTTAQNSNIRQNYKQNIAQCDHRNSYMPHFKLIHLQEQYKQKHSPEEQPGVLNRIFSTCITSIEEVQVQKPILHTKWRSEQKKQKKGISLNKNILLAKTKSIPKKMKLSYQLKNQSKPSSTISHQPYLKVQKTIKKEPNSFVLPVSTKLPNTLVNTKKKLSLDSYKPLKQRYQIDTERQTLKNRNPSIPTFSHIESKTSIGQNNKLFNTNSTWNDEAQNTLTTNFNSKEQIGYTDIYDKVFTFTKIPAQNQENYQQKKIKDNYITPHNISNKQNPILWKKKQKAKNISLLTSLTQTNKYLDESQKSQQKLQFQLDQKKFFTQQIKEKMQGGLQNLRLKLQMNDLFWPSGILGNSQQKNQKEESLNRIIQLKNFDSQQEFLQRKNRKMNDSKIQIQFQQDSNQNSQRKSTQQLQNLVFRQISNSQELSEGQLACLLRFTHEQSNSEIRNQQSQTQKLIQKLHVTTKKMKNKFVSLDEYANTIITKWDGSDQKSSLVQESMIVYQCSKDLKNLLNEYQNKYRGSCQQKSQIQDIRLLKSHQSIQEECQVQLQNSNGQIPSFGRFPTATFNLGTYTALNFSQSQKSQQSERNVLDGKLCLSKDNIDIQISQLQIN